MPRLYHRHYHYHYGYNDMSLFVPVILILSLEKSINIETIIPPKNCYSGITFSLFVMFSCATKFSPIGQNLFLSLSNFMAYVFKSHYGLEYPSLYIYIPTNSHPTNYDRFTAIVWGLMRCAGRNIRPMGSAWGIIV